MPMMSDEEYAGLASEVQQVPPKSGVQSVRELLFKLQPHLRELQAKGYNAAESAQIVGEAVRKRCPDVGVTEAAVKAALYRSSGNKKKPRRKRVPTAQPEMPKERASVTALKAEGTPPLVEPEETWDTLEEAQESDGVASDFRPELHQREVG